MGYIEPNPQLIQDFLSQDGPDGPIVMINLLRYREKAEYPDGVDAAPGSGREAYQRYGAAVTPQIVAVGGRPLWMGAASVTLIGPDEEQWDDAVLVEYPSRKAFVEMVTKPEYLANAVHRTAALEDSRLICTETRASFLEG